MAGLEERVIGSIAVLFGNLGGKYPDGKALLVRGTARRRSIGWAHPPRCVRALASRVLCSLGPGHCSLLPRDSLSRLEVWLGACQE